MPSSVSFNSQRGAIMVKLILILVALFVMVTVISGSLLFGGASVAAVLFFAWIQHRDKIPQS